MTVAHLSDTHIGFRAFARNHPSGINQRSVDIMASFRQALDAIAERDPDLVLHAGDMYHAVRPANLDIVESFRLLFAFQERRKFKPLVLVGGNHDTPKSADHGNIQRLLAQIPGVMFAPTMAQRFDIRELDCEVLCIPSNSLVSKEEVAIRPEFGRRYSVLSVHGMASQALPKQVDVSHAAYDVNDLHLNLFTYIGLGDYHVHQEYAPNCCFSGALDYCTSNIWEEVGTPKGWVWFNTAVGQLEHVPISTRQAIDLPAIDASLCSVDEIRELMISQAQFEGEPIVRQKIVNLHREDKKLLFGTTFIREINSRCLNYQVVCTPPQVVKATGEIDPTTASAASALESLWPAHVKEAKIPSGVDRDALESAGLELLKEAALCA